MHMADALLVPVVAGAMYAASGAAVGASVYQLRKEDAPEKLPTMAVTAALVFAGQMVNYTIPGTGSSGHLCGGMLLSALLGPQAGLVSMAVILTIQCLFFADGGLMALGANIWNMGFYGCFVGYYLIWRPILGSGLFSGLGEKGAARAKIVMGSILGCVVTLQLGAFSVVLETALSGVADLPFGAFAALMQPIHLAIGLVEGLITSAVLLFLYEARPELIRDLAGSRKAAFSLKATVAILAVLVVTVGGGVSLLASANPDGLEWTLFGNEEAGYSRNLGLDEESYGAPNRTADAAAAIQEKTAFLPDYGFAESDSPAGTSVSGLVGSAMVAAAALGICAAGGFFRKKRRVSA